MATIYISHSQHDKAIAVSLGKALEARGHEILADIVTLVPGQDWRAVLSEGLKRSDAVVTLLTHNSISSQFVISETGAARAYAQITKGVLVIPVLLDDIPLPNFVGDLQAIIAPDRNIDKIASEIDRAVTVSFGMKMAQEKAAKEIKEKIELNAAIYIDDAIQWLRKNEKRDRRNGTAWSALGYATLVAGVGFGFYGMSQASNPGNWPKEAAWAHFAYIGLKSVIVIGLLLACSKYAFTIGKTYMSESLKSSDRIHAISFGKFYLRAYGEKAQWLELKEAFQHWNVDRASSFSALDTAQFDPKFVEAIMEIAKVAKQSK
jgi:hypothetical protein